MQPDTTGPKSLNCLRINTFAFNSTTCLHVSNPLSEWLTNPTNWVTNSAMAIVELKREVDEAVITLLQDALERAKTGETTGIIVVESTPKTARWANAGKYDRFELAGYLLNAANRSCLE